MAVASVIISCLHKSEASKILNELGEKDPDDAELIVEGNVLPNTKGS